MIDRDKIDVANQVLKCFAEETRIVAIGAAIQVVWKNYRRPGETRKRWITRGQDFYPVWSNKWPHGGTACTAMANLIRWTKGLPVLPLSTWRYWGGERVQLGRESGPQMADLLQAAGYPEVANCVLCGIALTTGFDWWSLKGVSGPCCNWKSGCRQVRPMDPAEIRARRGAIERQVANAQQELTTLQTACRHDRCVTLTTEGTGDSYRPISLVCEDCGAPR